MNIAVCDDEENIRIYIKKLIDWTIPVKSILEKNRHGQR